MLSSDLVQSGHSNPTFSWAAERIKQKYSMVGAQHMALHTVNIYPVVVGIIFAFAAAVWLNLGENLSLY